MNNDEAFSENGNKRTHILNMKTEKLIFLKQKMREGGLKILILTGQMEGKRQENNG